MKGGIVSDYHEMAQNLKVRMRIKEFFLEKRIKEKDRRKAFFSFVEIERRKKARRDD
jgi:hypothetical protein